MDGLKKSQVVQKSETKTSTLVTHSEMSTENHLKQVNEDLQNLPPLPPSGLPAAPLPSDEPPPLPPDEEKPPPPPAPTLPPLPLPPVFPGSPGESPVIESPRSEVKPQESPKTNETSNSAEVSAAVSSQNETPLSSPESTPKTPADSNEWGERCVDMFQIMEQVGEGTYGQVYKAKDKITGTVSY